MAMLRLKFDLSRTVQAAAFIERGVPLDSCQHVEVPLALLRTEVRRQLAERGYSYSGTLELKLTVPEHPSWGGELYTADFLPPAGDVAGAERLLEDFWAEQDARDAAHAQRREAFIQSVLAAEPASLLAKDGSWYNGEMLWDYHLRRPDNVAENWREDPRVQEFIDTRLRPLLDERNTALKAQLDQRRVEREAEDAARTAARKEADAAFQAGQKAWITVHGSERLRLAEAQGYHNLRSYVTERAALEYPDYVVDFDDDAEWEEKSSPSLTALREAARVKGEIVWLETAPAALEPGEYYEWEAQEAVVVREFLGKYDLVRLASALPNEPAPAVPAAPKPAADLTNVNNALRAMNSDLRCSYATLPLGDFKVIARRQREDAVSLLVQALAVLGATETVEQWHLLETTMQPWARDSVQKGTPASSSSA